MRKISGSCLVVLAFVFVLASIPLASACEVPVYRYAVENWDPAPFLAAIFHDKPLGSEVEQAVTNAEGLGVALKITAVGVSGGVPEDWKKVFEPRKDKGLPLVILLHPPYSYGESESDNVAWCGPFDPATFSSLWDSPARREIVKRILDGHSAVWALLDSGNAEKDAAAAKTLEDELKKLVDGLKDWFETKKVAIMSDPLYGGGADPVVPLKLEYSMVRVSRTDPLEQVFASTLQAYGPPPGEEGLEPMAFPIFGRGRSLPPLIGSAIGERGIREVCDFIMGDCSCVIKEMNPGADVLMPVDWEAKLSGLWSQPQPEPTLTGVLPDPAEAPGGLSVEPARAAPPAAAGAPERASGRRFKLIVLGAALAVVLVVAAVSAIVLGRSRTE